MKRGEAGKTEGVGVKKKRWRENTRREEKKREQKRKKQWQRDRSEIRIKSIKQDSRCKTE